MTPRQRRVGGAIICLLPLCAVACDENDEQLVENVGVTRLFVIDTGLLRQSIVSPDNRVQAGEWEITEATLEIEDTLVDLLVDPTERCSFTDTVFVSPIARGACASGIVIESSEEPLEVRLALTVSRMQVRRADPIDLSETIDYDQDGKKNDGDGSGSAFDRPCGLNGLSVDCDDNCPLVSNPDQKDDDGDGIGNACVVFDFFSGFLRDSDADGVADAFDNCVWYPNPDQTDTGGLGAEGIPDGIGDACTLPNPGESDGEQIADVLPFVLDLEPTTLLQPLGLPTFITVDFDSRLLDCDWTTRTCKLEDPATVEFCTHLTASGALGGC